ncbi:MAG: LptF/LptG family permease [Helicobacteraceae bacterium]|nr:LptF/LptG family permease [Helicobacteraceae bacterium]
MRGALDRYLLAQFWVGFFPLFGALFLIATMVSFVQLSAMTAVVKISFYEMFLLYLGQLPQLLLYVLPIAFFAGLITETARLSGDLEMIALFSLKADIWRIMRPFVPLALVLALGLSVLGFVVAPKAQYLQKALLFGKQDDAQINIRSGEFGQRFGDWLLFVGAREGENEYRDIALYSVSNAQGAGEAGFFAIAKSASVNNDRGVLRFDLLGGRGYEVGEDRVRQIDYEVMRLNETGRVRSLEYSGVIDHWLKAKTSRITARELVWAVLAVIFTIVSLPAAAIGVYSPRFAKNRSGAWALALSVLFYAPAMTIGDRYGAYAFITLPIWLGAVLWIARRKLERF